MMNGAKCSFSPEKRIIFGLLKITAWMISVFIDMETSAARARTSKVVFRRWMAIVIVLEGWPCVRFDYGDVSCLSGW